MTTQPAIEIAGLTKSYGDHAVLTGVDLSVPAGTIFALLGSNGAGKTTAVKILSTLLKADGGTASVNGHDVSTEPEKVRESISLTGQFAAVDEILTGRENLVLVARLRRLDGSGAIADAGAGLCAACPSVLRQNRPDWVRTRFSVRSPRPSARPCVNQRTPFEGPLRLWL